MPDQWTNLVAAITASGGVAGILHKWRARKLEHAEKMKELEVKEDAVEADRADASFDNLMELYTEIRKELILTREELAQAREDNLALSREIHALREEIKGLYSIEEENVMLRFRIEDLEKELEEYRDRTEEATQA